MKAIGIDLGERRVGVAVSDPDGIVATPYAVIDLNAKSGSSAKASKSGCPSRLPLKHPVRHPAKHCARNCRR